MVPKYQRHPELERLLDEYTHGIADAAQSKTLASLVAAAAEAVTAAEAIRALFAERDRTIRELHATVEASQGVIRDSVVAVPADLCRECGQGRSAQNCGSSFHARGTWSGTIEAIGTAESVAINIGAASSSTSRTITLPNGHNYRVRDGVVEVQPPMTDAWYRSNYNTDPPSPTSTDPGRLAVHALMVEAGLLPRHSASASPAGGGV